MPSATMAAATTATATGPVLPTSGRAAARDAAGRGRSDVASPSIANAPSPSAGNSQTQPTEPGASQYRNHAAAPAAVAAPMPLRRRIAPHVATSADAIAANRSAAPTKP